MGNPAVGVLYVLAMVGVVVGLDLLFFRDNIWFWERLAANDGARRSCSLATASGMWACGHHQRTRTPMGTHDDRGVPCYQ